MLRGVPYLFHDMLQLVTLCFWSPHALKLFTTSFKLNKLVLRMCKIGKCHFYDLFFNIFILYISVHCLIVSTQKIKYCNICITKLKLLLSMI